MKKRILSILLCGTMLLGLLAGCGSTSSEGNGDASTGNDTGVSTENNTGDEAPGEIETISVYTMCQGVATDYANVMEKINEITTKEIGVQVELTLLDMGQYFQQYFMLLSGSEEMDLIASYYDLAVAANNQGAFLELNDLVEEYGQDIKAQFLEEDFEASKINGVLYGIPTQHANSIEIGFLYN